ncbi:hypothetical protein AKO1_007541, partial [Acrasis kona]
MFQRMKAHNESNNQKLFMNLSCVEVYNEETKNLSGIKEFGKCTEFGTTCDSLIELAIKNRTVAATQYNQRSSRSHCLYKFTIHKESNTCQQDIEDEDNLVGVLNLIDLAGSERLPMIHDDDNQAQEKHQRKSETKHINTSLYSLSQALKAMVRGSIVDYRSSTLTRLLKEDLTHHNKSGSKSKIVMFVNIKPPINIQDKHIDKTISSLQFAKDAHTFD